MRITAYLAHLFGWDKPRLSLVLPSDDTTTTFEDNPRWSPGDRCLTPKGNVGSIRAIVDDEAWVRTGKGQNVVVHVTLLDEAPV